MTVVVSRKRLLRTTLRAINEPEFSFTKRLHVMFVGEDGDDFRGPRCELFRWVLKYFREQPMLRNPTPNPSPCCDSTAVSYLVNSLTHSALHRERETTCYLNCVILHGVFPVGLVPYCGDCLTHNPQLVAISRQSICGSWG